MTQSLEASRQILWNVSAIHNVVLMYLLFGISLVALLGGVLMRVWLWVHGRPEPDRLGRWAERIGDLWVRAGLQRDTNRERTPALFHSLIYLGFLVLTFTTTMVLVDHDLGIRIYRGDFYLAVTILSDVFGLALLIGVLLAAHRRYIQKADLVHNRLADSAMLTSLGLLVIQGFLLEGLRIHATRDPWAAYSPVGYAVARFFWPLTPEAAALLHYAIWWFHTLTVFVVIGILPYTKFFHIISSSANLYFRRSSRPKGRLQPVGDIEKLMESGDDVSFGLGTIKDYSWKQLLDLDACTQCGRCQDACPAYIAGTPLSPKWLILDTRNHALALQAKGSIGIRGVPIFLQKVHGFLTETLLLKLHGLTKNTDANGFEAKGAFRGRNPKVHESARVLGRSADDRIASDVMDPDVFWSCTTCMACVEACPVGIHQLDQIIGNRRNMALMQGELPSEAQPTLRALETRGNPYGKPEDRMKWALGIDVPIVDAGSSVDYLYWVGCVSAYDPRKQKIARALVTLMRAAGLSFGVLGEAEGCSGDPARRLGEENLYQTLAKSNLELLKSIQFKTLVANCPHCFNTIKNEYPEFGNLGNGESPKIIHHSALLRSLVHAGKLKLRDVENTDVTFHDPCYLGRYNDEYEAPRETLKSVKGLNILEMERSKEKGMCCGAGGGHFWMDLKLGERINNIRTDQAAETGAHTIATACPFCMQMMEDGVKSTGRDGQMEVKDIAEVLVEQLET